MKKILFTAIIILPALLFSCKSKKTTEHSQLTDQNNLEATYEEVNAMLQDMNQFSLGFYKNLSKKNPHENFSFSPASLNMAMAVVYSGARNDTRQQMSNVFGFDVYPDAFHPQYHAYFSEILNISTDTLVEFNLANRVFLEQSYPVLNQYTELVEKWHKGAFEKLDFIHQTRDAEKTINEWVEELTRKRIRNLIPQGSLSQLTRLVLVNAIYIKSKWKYPFDKNRTTEKNFLTSSGNSVPASFMMQRNNGIPYYETEEFIAMELPYTSNELSIIFIRPNDSNVPDISRFVPDLETYNKILQGLRPENVRMEIPSFRIESEFSLSNDLKDAGMDEAFDERADFSGISGERDLSISNVFQKVFFEIDEEGSEAAAATGIEMVVTSMPVDPPKVKEFIADRPFIFILKENRFHTPLFVGQFVK